MKHSQAEVDRQPDGETIWSVSTNWIQTAQDRENWNRLRQTYDKQ